MNKDGQNRPMESRRACSRLVATLSLAFMMAFPNVLVITPIFGRRKLRLTAHDLYWLAGLLFLVIAWAAAGSATTELTVFAVGFLSFKGGETLSAVADTPRCRGVADNAFQLTLLILLAFAAWQAVLGGGQRVAGPVWYEHPNVFGYALVIVGTLAATAGTGRYRLMYLVAALGGVILTGSRSALVAYFVTLGGLALLDRRRRAKIAIALGVGAALVVGASLVLPNSLWAQRILSPLYWAVGIERGSKNVLLWTEQLGDLRHWNSIGVDVTGKLGKTSVPAVWTIDRTDPLSYARPQQVVEVQRGNTYTLSADLREYPDATSGNPGFIGWASRDDTRVVFEVALTTGGAQVVQAVGLDQASATATDLGDGWRRLAFTFAVGGEGNVSIGLGVSPGVGSENVGDKVDLRELQLEAGDHSTQYQPAINRSTGVGEALVRQSIFAVAWGGIVNKPLYGHGATKLTESFVANGFAGEPPTHAHNLVLQILFSSGLLGLCALVGVLIALFSVAYAPQRALIIGVLVGNLFDVTFTAGVILYLLAFVVSFRGTGGGSRRRRTHSRSSKTSM